MLGGLLGPLSAQFTQQGPKLVGTGIVGFGARQGLAVAVSADGNTAIVGGPEDSTTTLIHSGAAWVFTRGGGVWSQQGPKLVGLVAQFSANEGVSVAISADGNTALVGANYNSNSLNDGAWVFNRSGGVWAQQGPKLVEPGTQVSYQGSSVALSADGNTAAVGAPFDNNGIGAVRIFVRAAGVWTQRAKLIGADTAGSLVIFGGSVAFSADGNTVAIGGRADNNAIGAVWVFTNNGGQWLQQGPKLPGAGYSPTFSADGNTLLFGGSGSASVFTRTGGVWTRTATLTSPIDRNPGFGASAALSGDGNTALVGSVYGVGATLIFKKIAGVWNQQNTRLVGSDAIGDSEQGFALALSADGNTLLIGGLNDDPGTAYGNPAATGATWVLVRTALVLSTNAPPVAGVPSSFTVSAVGPGNVVQSSYTGTVSLATTDAQSVLPHQSKLLNGVGTFSVTFQTPGTQTITASDSAVELLGTSSTLLVRSAAIQVSPGNLALQYFQGAEASSATSATLTVSSDASISFTVASASPWITAASGVAPAAIVVKADPTGLNPGTYNSSITVRFADGRSIGVPISLVVYGLPQLTLSTGASSALTFLAESGSAAVQTRDLTVVAQIRNVTVQVSAATLSPAGRNWLFVTPAGGTTPVALQLLVNPAGLSPGDYHGFVTVVSSSAGNSPLSLPVTLSVSAPAPAISVSVFANAASYAVGAGAPNTLLAAFGEFPGCSSGAKVSLDGAAASVFASTPNQINFLVPPEIAGKSSTLVQVSCAGLTSQTVPLEIAGQAPAIFTLAQNGTGQAAIVNQDGSTAPPSAAGTIVTVYGTGFGLFSSPETDGLARISRTVTASTGGVEATVVYAGEAPGYTSGLQQINVLIPAASPRGPQVPLRLTVDGVDTQAGVTLAIQ